MVEDSFEDGGRRDMPFNATNAARAAPGLP
jgi:hypothetical protein